MESPAAQGHIEAMEPFVFVDLHDPNAWVEVENVLPDGSEASAPAFQQH
jgi:hypothetical protein